MLRTKCKHCGKINYSFSLPLFCSHCHVGFSRERETKKPASVQVKDIRKAGKKVENARFKKSNTVIKDKINTAKTDMMLHIIDKIRDGWYTVEEFIADPSVYYDSQIMGKYINNPILKKAIARQVYNYFIPF